MYGKKQILVILSIVMLILVIAQYLFQSLYLQIGSLIVNIILVMNILSIKSDVESEKDIINKNDDTEDMIHSSEIKPLLAKITTLTNECSTLKEKMATGKSGFLLSKASQENSDKMSKKGVGVVQESITNLTNEVFALSYQSKETTKSMESIISSVTQGDDSLENSIVVLNGNIGRIDSVIQHIGAISTGFTDELERINETFQSVKDYTKNISDLADQTNILAINASIEAARFGLDGKGFSVIAGEIRKLSANSIEFVENINSMITETASKIEHSFNGQRGKILNSSTMLSETQRAIKSVAGGLEPQIEVLTDSIKKSSQGSEMFTKKLDDFTLSIQFMDLVRQIIENGIKINIEALGRAAKSFSGIDSDRRIQDINDEAIEIAKKHMTTKEEFDALGLSIKTSSFSNKKHDKELQGNVSLF